MTGLEKRVNELYVAVHFYLYEPFINKKEQKEYIKVLLSELQEEMEDDDNE